MPNCGPEGFEADYGFYRWTTEITAKQLAKKVTGIGNITDVVMKERSTGGIGKVLLVKGSAGSKEILGEGQIRAVLGSADLEIRQQNGNVLTGWDSLPSAFIAIEKKEGESEGAFLVWGGGYGHGVGMSQNGAQAMAKAGKSYKQILEMFYDGTEVAEIDEIPQP